MATNGPGAHDRVEGIDGFHRTRDGRSGGGDISRTGDRRAVLRLAPPPASAATRGATPAR